MKAKQQPLYLMKDNHQMFLPMGSEGESMDCMSQEIGALALALAKVQAVMEPAQKNASNPMLRNKYADLASCYEACRSALPMHGLAVSQILLPAQPDTVCVRTVLLHESGQWLSSDCTLPAQGNRGVTSAQAAGSAITYARRYGLSAILGIVADDDDDGNHAGQHQRQAPRQQAQEPRQQARQQARQANPHAMTGAQSKALMAYLSGRHGDDRDAYLAELSGFFGRHVSSSRELTKDDVSEFLNAVHGGQNA